MALTPGPRDVLIVVDVQNDFLPGGSLAVADGNEIIAPIERLARRFSNILMTQDWHPADHISFASNHPGKTPFETIELDYGTQVLWPDHCVIGTQGAAFAPSLTLPSAQLIIRKGFHRDVDSYSGFREADRQTSTGLAGYLRERDFDRVFVVGLATDFCVGWTALDAREAGFEAIVVEDACRAIDAGGSLAKAWADMSAAGVGRTTLAEIR
jgi:nicotinamidase/pyrazinamidase